MSYSGSVTALETALGTAALTLTPVPTVLAGEPWSLGDVHGLTLAHWYTGNRESSKIPPTMGDFTYDEGEMLRLYWPITLASGKGSREIALQAAGAALISGLLANIDLGGACDDVEVGEVTTAWAREGTEAPVLCRTLSIQLWFVAATVASIG